MIEISFTFGLAIYMIVWFLTLFMVLPFGARAAKAPEEGHAPSAPEKPRILIKLLITTIIAMGLWVVVWLIIQSGWFSFRDLARIDAGKG